MVPLHSSADSLCGVSAYFRFQGVLEIHSPPDRLLRVGAVGRREVEESEKRGGGVKRGVWILIGVVLVVAAGGFLAGKRSFSESSPSPSDPATPPLKSSPFKMSGVITSLDLSDPQTPRLTLKSEGGNEKTVFLIAGATIVSEGKPLGVGELKAGDVIDIDCEFDAKTEKTFVQRADVVVRTMAATVQEGQSSKDPEFE